MKNKWIEMMKKMKAVCFAAGLGFLTVAGSCECIGRMT